MKFFFTTVKCRNNPPSKFFTAARISEFAVAEQGTLLAFLEVTGPRAVRGHS